MRGADCLNIVVEHPGLIIQVAHQSIGDIDSLFFSSRAVQRSGRSFVVVDSFPKASAYFPFNFAIPREQSANNFCLLWEAGERWNNGYCHD